MSVADVAGVIAELLERGHAADFHATGDSMDPIIRSGDLLRVEAVDAAAVRAGDVVLARLPRGLTAHRVVRREGTMLVTKGDNATGDDGAFDAAALLGRVVSLERAGRRHAVRALSGSGLLLTRLALRLRRRLLR